MKNIEICIKPNIELDLEVSTGFFNDPNPYIHEVMALSFPDAKKAADLVDIIRTENQKPEFTKALNEIKNLAPKFIKIAKVISEVLEEDWMPIDCVTIFIGTCPIAPRFLDINAFLIGYYRTDEEVLNAFAHEAIHFLYFKKWAKLFPEHNMLNFNYPDPVWVLSEILALVIGNDQRIALLAGTQNAYPNWEDVEIVGDKPVKIFQKLYEEKTSVNDFLINSWRTYQDLDREYDLTEKLI